jgi:hypothetical protein
MISVIVVVGEIVIYISRRLRIFSQAFKEFEKSVVTRGDLTACHSLRDLVEEREGTYSEENINACEHSLYR